MGIVRDDYALFLASLQQAVKQNNLVVISGGSSVGAKDFSVSAIESVCTDGILFHGLAIKPGKPTIFGMAGSVPVFGLPGHPVAALTVCGELVKTVIRQMYRQSEVAEGYEIPATLGRNIPSAPGRDDFVNVRLIRKNGGYIAEPLLGKSGLIAIMAKADGILHIQSAQTGLYEGDPVMITPIARPERK
jgi:molybdopterin molybdotransferase